jgi:hypothetical protein
MILKTIYLFLDYPAEQQLVALLNSALKDILKE